MRCRTLLRRTVTFQRRVCLETFFLTFNTPPRTFYLGYLFYDLAPLISCDCKTGITVYPPILKISPLLRKEGSQIIMPVKKWIMFDLDNTLIDTELLAFECAAPVANRILEVKGITERYTTTKLLSEWFGQPWKVMLQELAAKHEFTISDEERKTWAKWEEDLIIAAVQREGQPTQGVEAVIEALLDNPNYRIAIVSSSSLRRMYGCLDGTGMRKYFDDRHIFSAHTSLETPTPKPAPAVYKFALESLGITADEALAIEDSRGGAIAAVGAGIDAIGYVGCINIPMMQAQLISDFEAVGAKATMRHWQEFFGLLAEIEKEDDSAVVAGDGINQAWV